MWRLKDMRFDWLKIIYSGSPFWDSESTKQISGIFSILRNYVG